MDSLKPPLYLRAGKSKYLDGDDINADERIVTLLLPDDALSSLGYARGDEIDIRLGSACQGDLAAVRTSSGRWHVGFVVAFEDGLRLSTSYNDLWLGRRIVAVGRVVRHNGRAVLQAGITLPEEEEVSRFRFKLPL